MAAIDRVLARYPHLADDSFVREHLDQVDGVNQLAALSSQLSAKTIQNLAERLRYRL